MKTNIFLKILFVGGLLLSLSASAQTTPSSKLRLSILTCAAGEDIYTAWGHTALRIIDSSQNLDVVFNFGTFNFEEPYFITKFIKGSLNYFISENYYRDFIVEYQTEGRDIKEQVLNLTDSQKIKWYAALRLNNTEENKYYLYNFIDDNCTTRIKQGLFNFSSVKPVAIEVKSYREQIVKAPYEVGIPWIGLGIDLLLGAYSDQKPDEYKAGFLPELLFIQVSHIRKLVTGNNTYHFTTQKNTLPNKNSPFFIVLFFLLFYILVSKINSLWTVRIAKLLDIFLLLVFTVGGSLMFYMSFISLHTACYQNFNLMWMHPLYLIALVLYFIPKNWIGKIGLLFFSAILGLLISAYFLPQHFSKEVIALIGIALVLNYRLILKGRNAKFL